MTVPSVTFSKVNANTGVVPPSQSGVMAIIAPSQFGPINTPQTYGNAATAQSALGLGPAIEYLSYGLSASGKPSLAVVPATSTAATYGTIAYTGTGTMHGTPPIAGAAVPLDDYQVIVTFTTAGTSGTSGIYYTYSLDGGNTVSAPTALGIALSLAIPNSGVSFTLTTALTVVVGDFFTCNVTHARATSADLIAAFEALRTTQQPFEAVLVDGETSSAIISEIDGILASWEAAGKFKWFVVNTRLKNLPLPTGETEAAYATAMAAIVSSDSTIRGLVCSDGADNTSLVTGLTMQRPTSMFVAARAMKVLPGVMPEEKDLGPLPNASISDANGNPRHHDEYLYDDLDALRLVSLCTDPSTTGTFISNSFVLSSPGSDYVYLPHLRTMNLACSAAWAALNLQLSKGVRKGAPDPTTGHIYILEPDAQSIEAAVNDALANPLKGQVTNVKFTLSRTDDLSANSGVTIHGTLQIEALAYIKGFAVSAMFTKNIALTT